MAKNLSVCTMWSDKTFYAVGICNSVRHEVEFWVVGKRQQETRVHLGYCCGGQIDNIRPAYCSVML